MPLFNSLEELKKDFEEKRKKRREGEEKIKREIREKVLIPEKISSPVSSPNQKVSSIENLESLIEFVEAYQEFKRSSREEVLLRDLDEIKNEQRRIKDEMTRTMLEAEHTRAMINHDIGIIKMLMGVGIIVGLIWLARRLTELTDVGFAPVGVVRPLPRGIYTGRVVNPIGQGVVVPPAPAWEIERGSLSGRRLRRWI